MVKPRNVEDYRSLAAKRLPRMVFDYLDGGAESERGLRRNLAAFGNISFEPWRLLDVSQRDTLDRDVRAKATDASGHRADRPERCPLAGR